MARSQRQNEKISRELIQHLKETNKLTGSFDTEKGQDNQLLTEEYFDLVSRDHMYRILIENMSEGALVVNDQYVVVYSNKHFASFTGCPLQRVIGADFNSFVSETETVKITQCLNEARTQRIFCELILKTRKQGNIPILCSITSFHMDNQLYYCILIIDISFQKKIMKDLECVVEERTLELAMANRRLTDINHELNEVNKYLDNFVHAIAHDLRAPVANLKLIQEMLQVAPDKSKSRLLSSIYDNIHRLDSTLKGLVQIIRSKGDREPGKPDINVVRIINEVVKEQQVQIRTKNAEINIQKSTWETINYVEGYIRSIVGNMISNALKYAYPDRPPRLDIDFDMKDDHYIIHFTDNGMGIDLDKYGKDLFKPFKRFSSEGKGMGIGLHMINNMVQKNGGRIDVKSKPGEGTKFSVYLKEYLV